MLAGRADYIAVVFRLTRQEQDVICAVLLLLLVGWTVKAWRTAHPPPTPTVEWNQTSDAGSQF